MNKSYKHTVDLYYKQFYQIHCTQNDYILSVTIMIFSSFLIVYGMFSLIFLKLQTECAVLEAGALLGFLSVPVSKKFLKKAPRRLILLLAMLIATASVAYATQLWGSFFLIVPVLFASQYYDRHTTVLSLSLCLVMYLCTLAAYLIFHSENVTDLWTKAAVFVCVFAISVYPCYAISVCGEKRLYNNTYSLIQNRESQLENKMLQTKALISQMQPHFLYNTLSTIGFLCDKNPALAKTAIENFADYMRLNLDATNISSTVSFAQEKAHVETYLWMEKLRFGDMLSIHYRLDDVDFRIPPLTVQPLVENAIKHGIRKREDGGTLSIRTQRTWFYHEIIIEDDGVGFDISKVSADGRTHFGICNVRRRLQIICNGILEIKSEVGVGTRVVVKIPINGISDPGQKGHTV